MIQYVLLAVIASVSSELLPSCDRPVYCSSKLLHYVQTSRVYPSSKTFVDLQLRNDENTTLTAFQSLLDQTNDKPSVEQLKSFISEYFDETSELETWSPTDYSENPVFLNSILDDELKQFARNINDIWPTLGRKVKQDIFQNSDKTSMIPVSSGFIIPGGRFTELYYWDTYWIIEGLLISGMKDTAKGHISNLIELLNKLGHVPNGSRWYYQRRSQPPMLTAMMSLYVRSTNDLEFLRANIKALEKEMEYWMSTQTVKILKDNKHYTMFHYYAPSSGPRPESYYEDYQTAIIFDSEVSKERLYTDIKSAAESGWDFSSRWFISSSGDNSGNLTNVHTRNIIPVDLNSILANAFQNLANFQAVLGNARESRHWSYLARLWRKNIEEVFWNEKDGSWYDYDISNNKHRTYFYPTNIAPLWMGAVEDHVAANHASAIINYLSQTHTLEYPGGVPASLNFTGEQWDLPNAWPPLVSIVVNALEALETTESQQLAFQVAQNWVRACQKGYSKSRVMFEKYDANNPGSYGDGGEYTVQAGFGWSNGVVLEFMVKYGTRMTASDYKK